MGRRWVMATALALGATMAVGCSKAPVVNVASGDGGGTAVEQGIRVSGRGTVSGAPDTVAVSLGVSVKRPTAGAAIAESAASATRVLDALKGSGVADNDIQTSNYAINQEFRYPQGGTPQPDGYRVTNTVTAKVRDVARVGAVLDAAAAAGGDEIQVQGLSFSLDDDAAAQAGARERAFADARAKAEQFAELAGRELGAVQSVTQTEVATPPVAMPFARAALDQASSTPIEAGQVETEVTVEVRWAFAGE